MGFKTVKTAYKAEGKERGYRAALFHAAVYGILTVCIILAWWIVCGVVRNEYVVPSFSSVLKEIGVLLGEKGFYTAFFSTLWRVARAFFVSLLPAVGVAVLGYLFPVFAKFFDPIIGALRSLPTAAILLILLVWSTPDRAPVIVAFLALFPLLYTGTSAALYSVDRELVQMCKVYRVPVMRRILKMYLPIAAPYVVREAAGAISFALKLVVSAEIISYTYQSLGGFLQDSQIYTQTARMFAITLIVIFVGVLFETLGTALANAMRRRSE